LGPTTSEKERKFYFTEEHDKAILEYVATKDIKRRDVLYRQFIGPVFNELVEKVVYTYKFYKNLPNIDSLKEDCEIQLITVLDKFDPFKKTKSGQKVKAFTYFTVITRNWFFFKVKEKKRTAGTEYEELAKISNDPKLAVCNMYEEDRNKAEYIKNLKEHIDIWQQELTKPNEQKVLQAIQILFNSVEEIDIFNKKAIYLYIREITGLNTKQVAGALNKIRKKYRDMRQDWIS